VSEAVFHNSGDSRDRAAIAGFYGTETRHAGCVRREVWLW